MRIPCHPRRRLEPCYCALVVFIVSFQCRPSCRRQHTTARKRSHTWSVLAICVHPGYYCLFRSSRVRNEIVVYSVYQCQLSQSSRYLPVPVPVHKVPEVSRGEVRKIQDFWRERGAKEIINADVPVHTYDTVWIRTVPDSFQRHQHHKIGNILSAKAPTHDAIFLRQSGHLE